MGFFNSVGRKVEELKQTATNAAEDSAQYRCATCEGRFDTEHEHCPECGAASVEPVEE
jgi:rRNA maturation endonuclease Nob1